MGTYRHSASQEVSRSTASAACIGTCPVSVLDSEAQLHKKDKGGVWDGGQVDSVWSLVLRLRGFGLREAPFF